MTLYSSFNGIVSANVISKLSSLPKKVNFALILPFPPEYRSFNLLTKDYRMNHNELKSTLYNRILMSSLDINSDTGMEL
jgi:hypothetical protein